MGRNTKRTSKTSKTYELVYRPHDDPLYGDPNVSQWVLMRVSKQKRDRKQQEEDEDPFDYRTNNIAKSETPVQLEYDRREFELGEYNFDLRSYDYNQHLKERNPITENLSDEELEKEVSRPLYDILREVKSRTGQYIGVDMAARELEARKQLEEDRRRNKEVDKVLQLLEKDWSEEEGTVDEVSDGDDLEDNFVLIAQGEEDSNQAYLDTDFMENESTRRETSLGFQQLLEEKFEHFYASLYDSDNDAFDQLSQSTEAPENLDIHNSLQFTTERIEKLIKDLAGCSLNIESTSDKEIAKTYEDNEDSSVESQDDSLDSHSLNKETDSIFSFYSQQTSTISNCKNTPHLIGQDFHQERKNRTRHSSMTTHNSKLDTDNQPTLVEPTKIYRNKNETREEKKTRKQAVKEWNAFRRAKKSEWKKLFRQERQRQAKQIARTGSGRIFLETVNG
ncbi:hypothetical protein GpartN1_g7346.t1 [Galdieria partita]|uniref:Protein LTV1 homolog n=1 Tax=Galdieria partita TaxID=83374 RepID=A0A9C7Q4B8_9RHOD|nr:hypothetical protein GpartN1_g7346.t1 [Galdieria partita]